MSLYFNADTQARAFAGLQYVDDGSGVTLRPGELVDIDGMCDERWLRPADPQQSKDGARKVRVLDLPAPEPVAPAETPVAPAVPEAPAAAVQEPAVAPSIPVAEAEVAAAAVNAEQAATDLAAAQAAVPPVTPVPPAPAAPQGA